MLGVVGFLVLTSPWLWSATHPTRHVADAGPANLANGKFIFTAADCSTCHASPNQNNPLKLGGGRALNTAFGRFYMPNISPDPKDGIGRWTLAQFTRAVREGVGPDGFFPDGRNLYPAFPYTSYQRLTADDVRDLFAYIRTLPAVHGKAPDHDLKFPFNLRRGIGLWRLAFLNGRPLPTKLPPATAFASSAELARGRYLVEGPGHCAECHSPRAFTGAIVPGMRYGGGPSPDGKEYYPNISPDETGIKFWAVNSIVNYLKTGINPLGQKAGGDMAEVIKNTSQLPMSDLRAMAAYLKTVPPVNKPGPHRPEPNYTPKLVMVPVYHPDIALPTSDAAAIAKADTVYVVKTKPFYLNKADVGKVANKSGNLLATAKLTVLGRDGSLLHVRLDGWQIAGAPAAVFSMQGQRMMVGLLGDAAVAQAKRGTLTAGSTAVPGWAPMSLTFWIDDAGLNPDLGDLWTYSATLFNSTCDVCHSLPKPGAYLANQWTGNLSMMQRYTSLDSDQYRLLLGYLQNHARDVQPVSHVKQ